MHGIIGYSGLENKSNDSTCDMLSIITENIFALCFNSVGFTPFELTLLLD